MLEDNLDSIEYFRAKVKVGAYSKNVETLRLVE